MANDIPGGETASPAWPPVDAREYYHQEGDEPDGEQNQAAEEDVQADGVFVVSRAMVMVRVPRHSAHPFYRSGGEHAIPCASATAGWVTLPFMTLIPPTRAG